jgi:hypothetical protein
MDKQRVEKLDERRRQEDLVFNKVLVCFAGAVVYEMVAIFLQRFFVNYNQMSIEAVQFAMAIGNVLGLLRFVAPVLMIAALVWGVARNKKQKSVFLPVLLTVAGALLTFTAFMAYYFRGVGVSVLGAVAPVGVALTILFFLYQKEFFFSGIFVGMGIAALWVYRKAYLNQNKMVLAGFVAVWVILAVAALLAWKVSRNDGCMGKLQVVDKDANYALIYVSVALSAVALVLALVCGATLAYYAIFALVAWLFFMAVYYTVRMM